MYTCPSGLSPQIDPASGQVLYCYDNLGNVSYPPADDTTVTGPGAGVTDGGVAGLIGSISQDFLTAWQTITHPGVAPGQVGVNVALGSGGAAISGSPVLLIGLIAIVWLLVKKA